MAGQAPVTFNRRLHRSDPHSDGRKYIAAIFSKGFISVHGALIPRCVCSTRESVLFTSHSHRRGSKSLRRFAFYGVLWMLAPSVFHERVQGPPVEASGQVR